MEGLLERLKITFPIARVDGSREFDRPAGEDLG
jgi:hypothetical protein